MDHRKARFYGIWGQLIGCGMILLAIVYMNTPWLYIFGSLGVVFGLASVAVLVLFWRCPGCRKRLPADKSIFEIKTCPHCGKDLGLEIEENKERDTIV